MATTLGQRLKDARNDAKISQKELANRLTMDYSTLNKYENDRRVPDAVLLARISEFLNCDPGWLLTGKGEMHTTEREGESRRPFPDEEAPAEYRRGDPRIIDIADEFELIRRYDINAAAGAGTYIEEGEFLHYLAFRRDWLREMDLDPRHLAAIGVTGESMEPTLRRGDVVLVDYSVRRFQGDAIYVLNLNGLFMVKRLRRQVDGTLKITSDNPAFEPLTLADDQAELARLVGQVVWIGKRL